METQQTPTTTTEQTLTTKSTEKKLTKSEVSRARCGMVGGDGVLYVNHSGNKKLTLDQGLGICQGCGKAYLPAQVRALASAK